MANKLYDESSIQSIADAIRSKSGGNQTYKVREMAAAISEIETGTEPQAIEWHQCPEQARKFVNEVTYDPSDYTTSQIENYKPSKSGVSNYKPIGYTVDDITFYDEVPNVEKEFQTENSYGTVKPLDPVRYINTPAAHNVRDLGGWTCDGGTVKYGKLFRGGALSAKDREVLVDEIGIRHDLDLRGTVEANISVSPIGEDVYYTCADKYNWYSATITDAWKTNIRCVFDAVAHNEPVYFHCAAGADRTGTLACILEGLLGMSQSDIDKDYELTWFYAERRRNQTDWQNLIKSLNTYIGDTFRDKCINFVAQLGFTVDEVNAYRKGMINGTPEEISFDVEEYTVTNNLTNASTSNSNTTAVQYQPYTANITGTRNHEYVIESVQILMDGVDITSSAWKGTETNLYRIVTLNLENCTIDNMANKVIDGQGYVATVSVDAERYTLDGAEIIIMMGGTDVSKKYYKNGVIAIPNVTGNLEITVSAVPVYSNSNLVDIYGISDGGVRLSSSSGGNSSVSNMSNSRTVGANMDEDGVISYAEGDVFYIHGALWSTSQDILHSLVLYTGSADSYSTSAITYLYYSKPNTYFSYDPLNDIATIRPSGIASGSTGIRFSLIVPDISKLIITRNALPAIEMATTCPITHNLVNCQAGITSSSVALNGAFATTVTALDSDTADSFDIFRVSLGGEDVTDTYATIDGGSAVARAGGDADAASAYVNIPSVTNPLIITAISGGTDVISTSIDSDGNIFNDIGYKPDSYLNSASVSVDGIRGINAVTTGFIPVSNGDVFYFKDGYVLARYADSIRTCFYNESFTIRKATLTVDLINGTYAAGEVETTVEEVGMDAYGVTKMVFTGLSNSTRYVRFTLERPSADSVPKIYKVRQE